MAEACGVTPESLARHMQVWEVWMPWTNLKRGFGAKKTYSWYKPHQLRERWNLVIGGDTYFGIDNHILYIHLWGCSRWVLCLKQCLLVGWFIQWTTVGVLYMIPAGSGLNFHQIVPCSGVGGHSQVTATSRPLKYNTKLYVGDARSCIPKSQQISNDFTDQITS